MKQLFILITITLLWTTAYSQITEYPNKKISSKEDVFSGIKIYNHRDFQYSKPFKLYLSGQDTMRVLLLRCEYYGSEWIFFKKVTWLNDRGEKIEFDFTPKELNRQVGSGGYVYEIGKKDLDYEQIKNLKTFLTNANKVDVRFIGDKYYDTGFSQKKIKAALDMIDFFYTNNKVVDMLKEIYEMEQKLKNN